MIMLLFLAGALTFGIGGLMLLIAAFTESIWWGIFCIFIPPVNLLFILLNWNKAKHPLLVQAVGLLMMIVAGMMIDGFFSSMRHHPFSSYKQYNWSSSNHTSAAPPPAMVIDPRAMDDLPVLPDKDNTRGK